MSIFEELAHASAEADAMRVCEEIVRERSAQHQKWGAQNHPDGTGDEHYAWAAHNARVVCDYEHTNGSGTWAHILLEEVYEALAEGDPAKLRAELVQVAAVATAWVEAIDRRPPTRESEAA